MAAFRDVLIHEYEGVDIHKVWATAVQDLPSLRASIAAILPPLGELERELSSGGSDKPQS
jgi:uncharacterized protein with HEPN domain